MHTSFTELVGCRHPLQQAAMGGVAGPELAGAVAGAGALGMLCEFDAESSTGRMTQALALAGDGAVGMGFFGHWMAGDLATFEEAAARLRVVEVFWSDPDAAVVERARRSGPARVAWQVGTLDGARAAVDAGCDFVIVQGVEAGGHVRGTTPRDELLDAVLGTISVPVVSAGGIASAADVARVISAGAAGVRVGTRFVATTESRGHPAYLQALVDATSGEDTVLTTAFSGGWPDAPHRVLRSAVEAAEGFDGEVVGHAVNGSDRTDIARFQVSTPGRNVEGEIAAMALYAGTGVGDVTAVVPAADVVRELVAGLG
ncbi:MAG: nitronate monooxygenase [Actinomycetota bacterium]|jgi:NAD(P)H-dependent flavin oxidoreductase YrpB (nitropropane dioxygenase family)|nr:nitronate monooxygenase [Actinomycetota bacterium]